MVVGAASVGGGLVVGVALATTYGRAECLAAPLFPFLTPCSDSMDGITIFRGGTFGPGLSTLLIPSSPSLSPTADFGLPPLLLPLLPAIEKQL